MADNNLAFYDAAIAVTEEAVNTHFQKLFRPDGFSQTINIPIDLEHGKSVTGQMATPALSFLPGQSSLVKVTVPFGKGSAFHGGKQYNEKTQQLDVIETNLEGKSLGFVVDLRRLRNTALHDADLTIEALYVDLTTCQNIDTDDFGVELEDLGGAEQLFTGVTDFIKKATKLAEQGAPPTSLFVGAFQMPPPTPDTQGPMRPHEAAFSATVAAGDRNTGELNFLLMMQDHDLPTDVRAGVFNSYWGRPGSPDAAEATLVLSDYLLLESFVLPLLRKAWGQATFSLERGGVDVRSRVVQQGDCKLDDKTSLTGLVAQINDDGRIHIDLTVVSDDRLQVSQSAGKPDIDFSLLSIQLTKPLRYLLALQQDDTGAISCSMTEDQALRDAEPTEAIHWNGAVNKREDVVKWVTGLGLLLIPGVGPVLTAVMVGCQAIATTVEVQVNDRDALNSFGASLTEAGNELNTAFELPGSPVMTFGNLRMHGGTALCDARFAAIPQVAASAIEPYHLAPYPRETPGQPQADAQTEPQIVGESILSFRYVEDPDYRGARRSMVPYYLLRREQYWKRIEYKRYGGKTALKEEISFEVVQESASTTTIESATEIKVGAKGEVKFFDIFSPELSAEISHSLKTTTVTEEKVTTSKKVVKTVERPTSEVGYTIATWVAADRYTLRRPQDGKIIAATEVYNEDYLQEDRVNDPVTATEPG